jgi:hypothetical protein
LGLDWLPERMSPAFEDYWAIGRGILEPRCDRVASRRNTIIWAAIAKSRPAQRLLYLSTFSAGSDHTGAFCHRHELFDRASRQPAGGCGRVAQARSQQVRTSFAAKPPGFLRAGHGWVGTLRIAQRPTRATIIRVHSKAPHDPTENATPVAQCAKGQAHVVPQSPPSREGLVDVSNHATENMGRSMECEPSGCRGRKSPSGC